ncbi:MAG: hypothetical protein AAGB51_02855 [Planctomycetota bacterium]
MLRSALTPVLTIAVLVGQPAAAQEITNAEELLDQLETADGDLVSLTARIRYTRLFALAGDRQVRDGTLSFATLDADGDGDEERVFAIRFEHLVVGNRVESELKDYVFDGSWLVERLPGDKLFSKRQIAPPGSEVDPLKIGEGPLPIPIGQKKADILQRFDAELLPAEFWSEADPGLPSPQLTEFVSADAGTYQLRLLPKAGTEDATEFTEVRLWYSRDTLLPKLAITTDFDGDESFVQLQNVRINSEAPVETEVFSVEPPPVAEGWDVQIDPWRGRVDGEGGGQ